MRQTVIDKDGEWFHNQGAFPFVNPLTGVRFEAGEQVQVKSDAWIEGQPVLAKVKSPEDQAAEQAAAEQAAAEAVAAKEAADAKAAAAAAKPPAKA